MNPIRTIQKLEERIKILEGQYHKAEDEKEKLLHLHKANKHSLPRHGIDVAWGSPNSVVVKNDGYSFIVRYYSHDPSKDLTRSEAEDYSHHGLDIVTIYETTGATPLGGYHQGVSDAKDAQLQARKMKQPPSSAIYFAVDFEPTVAQYEAILGYFRGCKDVLGSRVGVYGGLETVKRVHLANEASYLWQTLAWSKGIWYPHSQLRQVAMNKVVSGVSCDVDVAVSSEFGQWRV